MDKVSLATMVFAVGAFAFCLALTVQCYMPCPWLDEWRVVADIARGATPWSWGWLWSQHGEHRIFVTRLLIWLDWALFGGKNLSLFVEMYAIQIAHAAVIYFGIERFTNFSKPIRRMLQGVFAFCLFHPYQAQNFTWAFQVSFLMPFAIGTLALFAVAHFERVPERWRRIVIVGIGIAPLVASMNLASGLLIGPTAVALAYAKRIAGRFVPAVSTLCLIDVAVYAYGYQTPANHPSPTRALLLPIELIRYVLLALDTTWHFFLMAPLSLACLAVCAVAVFRHREQISDFEWFCLAECGLALGTLVIIACGRIQYGIAQAGEGRYQTVAVLYWASLFALALIAVQRWYPDSFGLAQMLVALLALSTAVFLPSVWSGFIIRSGQNQQACAAVLHGRYTKSDVKQLDFFSNDSTEVPIAATIMRK